MTAILPLRPLLMRLQTADGITEGPDSSLRYYVRFLLADFQILFLLFSAAISSFVLHMSTFLITIC